MPCDVQRPESGAPSQRRHRSQLTRHPRDDRSGCIEAIRFDVLSSGEKVEKAPGDGSMRVARNGIELLAHSLPQQVAVSFGHEGTEQAKFDIGTLALRLRRDYVLFAPL